MAKLQGLNLYDIGARLQIAGVIYSDGEQHDYLCYFPGDASPDREVELLELDDEEWKTVIRQSDLLETEVLTKSSDGTLAKVILRKSTRQIETAVAWRVYRRDGYRCRYCGADNVPLTVDHLIPWEEGGPSVEQNLVASCKKCNNVRGTTPFAEWLQSDRYCRLCVNLTPEVRQANQVLVNFLDLIPRRFQKRSR